MIIENTYSLYLLMVCNGTLAGAAAIAILRFQRMMNKQKSFWDSPTGAAVSSNSDQDDFLKAVERRFAHLEEGIGSLSGKDRSDSPGHRSVPYENAVRMAKHGATVDDLTRTCGLSDIEARLLLRVHGQSANSSGLD